MTASQCISNLAQSWPPSVSPNSLDCGVQVRTITASTRITKLAWSWSRSASLCSLDHGPWVKLQLPPITPSKCISKLTQSRPQSVSLSSLDCHFEAHLELFSSTAWRQYRHGVCSWVAIQRHGWKGKVNSSILKIVKWYAVVMISRVTSSIPKEDVDFPRLLYCDSRCSQTGCQCSEACCLRTQASHPHIQAGHRSS